ncbi:MAG: sigma-70 family RNA polymerase sigma factor [Cytophagales bacterium]|nr:sigma-70 family RNA polymerase sigma factor [Cytophagales bacterium]MDW8384680.1 sigma-70 family RNA polymerase sigma factor [Flammeovirgaceae bacterium]
MPEKPKKQMRSHDEKIKIFHQELIPHINSIYAFLFKLIKDEEDAKDLVQETYMKAFRFIDSFETGTNAKAWLFKIAKNAFVNEYRRKSKEPLKIDYQEVEAIYNSDEADYKKTVDLRTEMLSNKIGDEVTIALNSLSVDFRVIVILCDVEGFTYKEMAKILDIPIGTVRSRLHRARQLLREKLKDYAESLGYNTDEKPSQEIEKSNTI